ncbi:MAG: hypothetical protein KatS3mg002_0333 [Candidatus Woesearchaeota archaeon]|nr:MAG: hypothetical protein KatS3mg002_0333 [Candidatus Woesearchaeota archaeon]
MSYICQICRKDFKSPKGLAKHVNQKHNISSEDYYAQYINSNPIRFCPYCLELDNIETPLSFTNIIEGYKKTCRKHLYLNEERDQKIKESLSKYGGAPLKDPRIKEKQQKTLEERYGVKNPSQVKEFIEKRNKTRELKKEEISKNISQALCTSEKFKESVERKKETFLEKYGVDNPSKSDIVKEKIRQTFLERYGVEAPMQIDEIKEKAKKTNLEKYGVENPLQSEVIRKKIEKTNLKKYGVKSTLLIPEVKEKIKKTMLRKYGVDRFSKTKEFSQIIKNKNKEQLFKYMDIFLKENNIELISEYTNAIDKNLEFKCLTCQNNFTDKWFNLRARIYKCPYCAPEYGKSSIENDIYEYIKSYIDVPILRNVRPFENNRLELDLYIPDFNFAIEFNGVYWHSEFIRNNKNRHLIKTRLCEKENISLFHIFDDEWLYKQDIIKSMILTKLNLIQTKIFARHCIIEEISSSEINQFYEQNHLQGYASYKDQKHIVLKYNNEIVSAITFSQSRFSKQYEWELLRFCNQINTIIPGGLTRLFKYFVKNYNPTSIVCYLERRLGIPSKGYEYCGFQFKEFTKPGYWYVHPKNKYQRESRLKYQKHKLEKLLEFFDPELTEEENMELNGYAKIWDCGQYVLEWYK